MPAPVPPILTSPPDSITVGTDIPPALRKAFPGYGEVSDVGENWRIKFADADGIPLNMLSFEQIDFGAIAYKEIFQNVKTILATPLFSAALERLLGVDQTIVDLPIDQAANATIAILDALYFWEPRVEVVDIKFSSDVISGHLVVNLQLRMRNVIYGTEQPYDRNNIFETPSRVDQSLPPVGVPPVTEQIPVRRPAGQRGSLWFTGTDDPPTMARSVGDYQANDMYLNTTTGDVFQFDGATMTWRNLGRPPS